MMRERDSSPCPACAPAPAGGLGTVSARIVSHSAGSRSCPPSKLGHDHPVVRLLIVISGQLELAVDRQRVSVGMGYGVFVEGETPYSYVTNAGITYVTADFSADHPGFRYALPEPGVLLGAPSLVAATSAFVAHTVTAAEASSAAAETAACQRAQVLAYIAAHYTESELSVATLAADFGRSTRSLQRLFEGQRKGAAEEIAAARLHQALTLLRDPLLAGATLEEIAARSGFGSVSRMRRAIQVATGRSPREHRAQPADPTGVVPGQALAPTSRRGRHAPRTRYGQERSLSL